MVWMPLKPLPPPPVMLGTRYLVACKGDDTVNWGVPNVRVHREILRNRILSSFSMSFRLFGRIFSFTFGVLQVKEGNHNVR